MKKGPLYTILFMLVITVVFTTVLAAANQATAGQVTANQRMKVIHSHLYAFGISIPDGARDQDIIDLYNRLIKPEKKGEMEVLEAYDEEGKIMGYGIPFRGPGLWGTIEGFLALSEDGKRILGIDFIDHSETPGLGARIDESFFKEQFRNVPLLDGSNPVQFRPNAPDGQVDAVTGASITSYAVEKMVNEAIRNYIETAGGEQ